MSQIECARERELFETVSAGAWPDRCDGDLRAHVASCALCADILEVARALQDDRAAACRDARVPGSAVVWWRAQMRARREAAQAAARPITVVHALALACLIGLVAGLVTIAAPWLQAWTGRVGDLALAFKLPVVTLPSVATLVQPGLLLALAAWLVLTPIAIYLALADD